MEKLTIGKLDDLYFGKGTVTRYNKGRLGFGINV